MQACPCCCTPATGYGGSPGAVHVCSNLQLADVRPSMGTAGNNISLERLLTCTSLTVLLVCTAVLHSCTAVCAKLPDVWPTNSRNFPKECTNAQPGQICNAPCNPSYNSDMPTVVCKLSADGLSADWDVDNMHPKLCNKGNWARPLVGCLSCICQHHLFCSAIVGPCAMSPAARPACVAGFGCESRHPTR